MAMEPGCYSEKPRQMLSFHVLPSQQATPHFLKVPEFETPHSTQYPHPFTKFIRYRGRYHLQWGYTYHIPLTVGFYHVIQIYTLW